jgi:hypothetical protein
MEEKDSRHTDQSIDVLPESADEVAIDSIRNRARVFVTRLGIPGLLVYNCARSSVVGVTVASIFEGSTVDRVLVGAAAGGINLIMSQTFWLAMGMIGARVGRNFLDKRDGFREVS